jgi:hypothetical protein
MAGALIGQHVQVHVGSQTIADVIAEFDSACDVPGTDAVTGPQMRGWGSRHIRQMVGP